MKGIVRFAEYSVTGGLLWLTLFLFLTLISLDEASIAATLELWQGWLAQLKEQLSTAQDISLIENTLSTLLAALSIILIFCTGLLLELISPLFCVPFQMPCFKQQLKRPQQRWLARLAEDNREVLAEDYQKFLSQPLFQLSDYRQWFGQRRRFLRMQTFIRAYLAVFASGSQMDTLLDQYRIWRISRSLFTSLVLLSAALGFLAVFNDDITHATRPLFWFSIVIPMALTALSYLSARALFMRLSANMLATAYHTYRQQQQQPAPPVVIEQYSSPMENRIGSV